MERSGGRFRREQQEGRVEPDMALRDRHIENLLQVPPRMIDNRKRHLALAVEEVLQFVALEAREGALAIRSNQMRANALLGVHRRTYLPLPAIEVEVRPFHEGAEQRYFTGLPGLRNQLRQ